MLSLPNLNEVFAVRPTWRRAFNFLFAPSVLVVMLELVISPNAPLTLGIKGMMWLFFLDQETRANLLRTSDISAQLATWVLFYSYCLMIWWWIIGVLWKMERERQSAKGRVPNGRQHERPVEERSGPGMLLSVRILAGITLLEVVQVAIAIAFLNLFLGFVVIVPNALLIFVLDFLGVSKSVMQFLALLECWLLSALLVLFAYKAHCSSGDQPPG